MPFPQSDASTCRSANNTFTLVVASRQLTWKSCSLIPRDGGDGPDVWNFVEGEKILTDAEYEPLSAALHALTLSSRENCGADAPSLAVTMTAARGSVTYLDDFYACMKRGSYVSGMNVVFDQFDKLTSSSSQ